MKIRADHPVRNPAVNSPLLFRFAALTLLALFLPLQELGATTVRLLSLEELVQSAERIFVGKCIDVRTGTERSNLPVTYVTFEVTDSIKGAAGKFVTIRQVGGDHPAFANFGLPRYQEGEEVLLFLHGESRLGLTSPVGLHQGKWTVQYSGGQRFLQRSLPAPLAPGGSAGMKYGLNLADGLHDYARFVGEVRRMVAQ